MQYEVFKGEYPFEEFLGLVEAPEDQPELALERAIGLFGHIDPHPVVQPCA